MSNSFLSKLPLKVASDSHTKLDLSCDHFTTHSLFATRPVYYRILAPGQSININHSFMCRTAPLFKPMFGSLRMINRAFFVPFHTVFAGWEAFITQTAFQLNGSTYEPNSVPHTYMGDLVKLFVVEQFGLATQVSSDTSSHDFASNFHDAATMMYYRYTLKGRRFITILQSLGYNINFISHIEAAPRKRIYEEKVSLLPLLAYIKIKADWYTQSQYPDQTYKLEEFLTNFSTGGYYDASTVGGITYMLDIITMSCYDQDFVTTVWDRPTSPMATNQSYYKVDDITAKGIATHTFVESNSGSSEGNGVPRVRSVNGSNPSIPYSLTQYTINALRSLTNYMLRKNIVGARAIDRYLAEYGVQSEELKNHRSVYLGDDSKPIQITDITSNVNNEQTVSGELAGKGVGFSSDTHFSYKTKDWGVIIIVSSVMPKIGYYQGLDRQYISRLDYYTPEFDQLGTEPVPQSMIYASHGSERSITTGSVQTFLSSSYWADGIFGYTPRYSSFKIARDFLSGDMRCASRNLEYQYYHLLRSLTDGSDVCDFHQQKTGTQGQAQFNRVFNNYSEDYDPLFCVHHFEVHSDAPFKSLYGALPLDGGDTVSMTNGGTQLN